MTAELRDELAAVEAILGRAVELAAGSGSAASWLGAWPLSPHTASDADKQYVTLTLQLGFPDRYPESSPQIQILRPRGLSDAKLKFLEHELDQKCEDMCGEPVIYAIIDHVCEFLTENNVPSSECSVCLYDITDADSFVKTACFHYFHALCLGKYVNNVINTHEEFLRDNPPIPGVSQEQERQLRLLCPVCRDLLQDVRLEAWLASSPPSLERDEDGKFIKTDEIEELQIRMQALLQRQLEKGSIIHSEAASGSVDRAIETPIPDAKNSPKRGEGSEQRRKAPKPPRNPRFNSHRERNSRRNTQPAAKAQEGPGAEEPPGPDGPPRRGGRGRGYRGRGRRGHSNPVF